MLNTASGYSSPGSSLFSGLSNIYILAVGCSSFLSFISASMLDAIDDCLDGDEWVDDGD